ncbi:HNH endonuclease [archaeon]|nr:HNH endonuclease [archaeon]
MFYKEYSSDNLPEEKQLEQDLKKVVSYYNNYLVESNVLTAETDFEAYTGKVEEGKRLLRSHYTRERNPKIVQEAKKKRLEETGELKCDVCGFSFYDHYGERAKDFIEAHHKKPISEMKPGDKTAIEDIALLCANCHRVIHLKMNPKEPYLTIEELKNLLK